MCSIGRNHRRLKSLTHQHLLPDFGREDHLMNEDEIIPPIAAEFPGDENQPPVSAGELLSATDSAVAPEQVERSSLAGFSAGEGKSFGVRAGAYIIDAIILNAVIFAGAVIGVMRRPAPWQTKNFFDRPSQSMSGFA